MRLVLVIVALTLAPAVLAGTLTVDRVQVGVTGRNATEGLSPSLFVDVPVAAGYTQATFDGEQGDWTGPDYTATMKPGTGRTDLSFRSIFDNHAGSLSGMVQKAVVHATWARSRAAAERVTRRLAGRTVGTVAGATALYAEPIDGSARFESVVALPLCHGVFGAVDFYADAPAQDTSGTAGQYLVGTTPAKQWNEEHAAAATTGVVLDGPLPGGRVAVHARGRRVTGVVADCGGTLQGVPLMLERGGTVVTRGVSGTAGSFSLAARGPGSCQVVASLGPFKAVSVTAAVR